MTNYCENFTSIILNLKKIQQSDSFSPIFFLQMLSEEQKKIVKSKWWKWWIYRVIAELNVIVVITQQMTIHGNKPKAQNVELIVLNVIIICASDMTGLFLLRIFKLKVHISVQLKNR